MKTNNKKANGRIILICGDLAAGKSTFSRKLSVDNNIVCLNKDDLKEILGDNFSFHNREENLTLSKCTFDIFKYCLLKSIESHNDIILESNFRQSELDIIKDISEKNGYKIISIILRCDIKILHERFMNRIVNENRHPVHKAVDYSNYNDFEKQILSDRNRVYPGENYFFDTSDFGYLYTEGVKKIIIDFNC